MAVGTNGILHQWCTKQGEAFLPGSYKSMTLPVKYSSLLSFAAPLFEDSLAAPPSQPVIASEMLSRLLPLSVLAVLATAHFQLLFPPSRGMSDEGQAISPCGGYAQTQNRTSVPLNSIPVSLELGHTENLITVALAIGNDVGSSFNTIVRPTIQEYGPGDFCWAEGGIVLPNSLTVTDGTNATVQVITNSHDGGGLYNVCPLIHPSYGPVLTCPKCADITFTSTSPLQPSSCTNGTGISASPLAANSYVFANDSAGHGGHAESSTTGTASSTGAAARATESSGSADVIAAGWGLVGAGVLGALALL